MDLPRELGPLTEPLLGRPELTPLDVAREAGVDIEQTRRLWRALGFPPVPDDARVFTRADAAVLATVRAMIDHNHVDFPLLVQLARVTGRSLALIAEAQVAAVETGDGGAMTVSPELVPELERSLTYVWRRHLLAALLRRAARPTGVEQTLVVGFADMVGFTALSQALDPRDLAVMVDRFEATVYEHVPQHGGRVVKMIGDEVMFTTDDVVAAADMALGLLEAHAENPDLPNVRVGLARGPVLSWEGDLFGPTVNLASRLVNVARPSSVLVSESLGQELQARADLELRALRPVRLQGIGRVRSFVLRRASAPAPAPKRERRRDRAGRG